MSSLQLKSCSDCLPVYHPSSCPTYLSNQYPSPPFAHDNQSARPSPILIPSEIEIQQRNKLLPSISKEYQYPCIRGFHFVSLKMLENPIYAEVLEIGKQALSSDREADPAYFMDLGCCSKYPSFPPLDHRSGLASSSGLLPLPSNIVRLAWRGIELDWTYTDLSDFRVIFFSTHLFCFFCFYDFHMTSIFADIPPV